MRRVHLTFHVSRFKPLLPSILAPANNPPPPLRSIESEQIYMVQCILVERRVGQGSTFFVNCEGYCPEEHCWVPSRDILDLDLICDFCKQDILFLSFENGRSRSLEVGGVLSWLHILLYLFNVVAVLTDIFHCNRQIGFLLRELSRKKPSLQPELKIKHLQYAKANIEKPFGTMCFRLTKPKLNLLATTKDHLEKKGWPFVEKNTLPTVKHGDGSIMLGFCGSCGHRKYCASRRKNWFHQINNSKG